MFKKIITSLALTLLTVAPALAHHPLGGEAPQTLMHGFLSGIGHPVIGFDHLAFVIGIGLLAAFQRSSLVLPVNFVMGTALGTLLILGGIILPAPELLITISVLLVGVLAMLGRRFDNILAGGIAALAGCFHGWAYGQAVIGSEATPVIAYIVGFAAVQMLIALAASQGAMMVLKRDQVGANLAPRLAGAMVAGVGITYLFEMAESAIFAAI